MSSLDADAIMTVNQRFYDAIETRDIDTMERLWEHSEQVACVHPGWPILRGWDAVSDSWRRILGGPGHNQFILTNTSVTIEGDIAWVVLDEDLVSDDIANTIASTNIFRRRGKEWLMVTHHGSPVLATMGPSI